MSLLLESPEVCDRRAASGGFSLLTALCFVSLIGASTLAQVATTPVAEEQIRVEVKMIEFSAETFAALPASARPADPSQPGGAQVFSSAENTAFLKALNEREGVFLLSSPAVITRSGVKASIESGDELRYPTDWQKAGTAWKPAKFETRRLGLSFEVTPALETDRTIELQMQSGRLELVGWKDVDTNQKLEGATEPESPEGRRALPLFAERKLPSTVALRAGQTAACWMLAAAQPAGKADGKQDRPLLVLVTATLLKDVAEALKPPAAPGISRSSSPAPSAKAPAAPPRR